MTDHKAHAAGAAFHTEDADSYFEAQRSSTEEWWARMPTCCDLDGKSVLDFGCGHGALSFSCLDRGAFSVLGIDLDEKRISHAQAISKKKEANVTFSCHYLNELDGDNRYDAIVSKDTFEHVFDPELIVKDFYRLLKPGGCLLIGFSPMYHSPFGHHGRLWKPLPWHHVLLPKPLLFKMASNEQKKDINSLESVGLNGLTPKEFRSLFDDSLWELKQVRYNAGRKRLMPLLRILRQIPALETLMTVNIYAKIIKR